MKIDSLKLNSYGNLNNKDIEFDKVNIVYGKNESGKTTLLSFIQNIIFGISKTKDGKSISDYDRYLPWNGKENFSGKINYELDDNSKYSIYRDFTKKKPEIYDEYDRDISDEYNTDKKTGVQIFTDQTGITKELMKATVISEQENVELSDNVQNALIQKIANLAESGDEEVSYKNASSLLSKLMLNEIGTDRSQDRPINVTKQRITELENKIEEIKQFEDSKYQFENNVSDLKEEIEEEKNNKKIYDEIKQVLNKNNEENEKIKIKEKIIKDNEEKIAKIKSKKEDCDNQAKKSNYKFAIMTIILLAIVVLNFIFIKNKVVNFIILGLGIIIFGISIWLKFKNQKQNLDKEFDVLNETNEKLKQELDVEKEEMLTNINAEKDGLVSKYGENIKDLFNNSIEEIIRDNREEINRLELEIHKQELNQKNIEPKLEEYSKDIDELNVEYERLDELERRKKIYDFTADILEKSYVEMKNNVSPRFNENLSKNIAKFSNEKYKNISIVNGINVELDDGRFVGTDYLSTGTIDQIYLALRLSVIDEISKEKMPIILDEAFAYYDDERLANVLKFLINIDNQLIIFSCTNREKEILKKLNVKYNLIEL